MKNKLSILAFTLAFAVSGFAQSAEAYGASSTEAPARGLLDPARLDIHHAVSFGAGGGSFSSIQSQSLYSTMIRYEFAKPVTLQLNFGLPIHSTFNRAQNLTADNIQSLEYLRSMPWDVSLSWQPKENLLMRFSVVRRTVNDYYGGLYGDDFFGSRTRNDLFRRY